MKVFHKFALFSFGSRITGSPNRGKKNAEDSSAAVVVAPGALAAGLVVGAAVVVSSFNDKLLTAINAASVKSREFLILSKESRLFLGTVVKFEEGLFDGDTNINAAMLSSRGGVAGLESWVVETGSSFLWEGDARGVGEDIFVFQG